MNLPLIDPSWDFALWASLLLLTAFGFAAEKTKIGQSLSGAAIILGLSMLLSNIGILPISANVYDVVWEFIVPLAIPLLLLKANLRKVISGSRGILIAFTLGAIGTSVGALSGFFIFPLGEFAPKLAAVFSATYIGGSMNMVAVTQAVELEPTIASAALAADNLVGVLYLAFLALFPSFILINKWFEHNNKATTATSVDNNAVHEEETPTPINLQHIAFALGLSFTICAVGKVIATALGVSGYSILFITAISLICANLFPQRLEKLKGDYEIGMFFMYLFFAALGVNANIEALLDKSLVIIAYAFYIVCCHAIVLLVGSKILKINLDEVLIASSACAIGPASAAAIGASRGRKDLIASGVLIGVLGYAVANFIGVAINLFLS